MEMSQAAVLTIAIFGAFIMGGIIGFMLPHRSKGKKSDKEYKEEEDTAVEDETTVSGFVRMFDNDAPILNAISYALVVGATAFVIMRLARGAQKRTSQVPFLGRRLNPEGLF